MNLRRLFRRNKYGMFRFRVKKTEEFETYDDVLILKKILNGTSNNKAITLNDSGTLDLEVGNGPA